MKKGRTWMAWLVLVGVFLAGGVAGGFISLRVAKTMIERGRGPDRFAPRFMERLTEGLDLTPEQQAQLKPIVDRTWVVLREQRHASITAMRDMEKEVIGLLTPEQKIAYEEMQAAQRERWKDMMGKRGDRPSKRGDMPPPGGPPMGEPPPAPPEG
ncbi:hypothetical protein [Synoicihabitans lomoniglobus]|uniref:Periplasmic heavy metal sensor n=1 Tax=Synoicihabitans lomoniglobus TaxID=2909285 RepID=A0AAF0CQ10_9BACT|nr:periplasmic heavy metal sensor [Opitutaceae bacterium LMO-M01]WED65927.1 hypothetical protein PXH66_03570 [Opitutaceae bacterium LMO-M01]